MMKDTHSTHRLPTDKSRHMLETGRPNIPSPANSITTNQSVDSTGALGTYPQMTSSMTPEQYAQYAYMYNYMYMQHQMGLNMAAAVPQQMYAGYYEANANLNSSRPATSGNSNEQQLSPTSTPRYENISPVPTSQGNTKHNAVDNVHALAKQQMQCKSSKDNVNMNTRYNPYARPSTQSYQHNYSSNSSPVLSPVAHQSSTDKSHSSQQMKDMPDRGHLSHYNKVNNVNNINEDPIDLSRKGEKLHFLNTLKNIIESRDRMDNANKNVNVVSHTSKFAVKDNPVLLDLSQNNVCKRKATSPPPVVSASSSTSECSQQIKKPMLKSQQDKLGYLSVLKELFEKGHSTTSQKILKKPDSSERYNRYSDNVIVNQAREEKSSTASFIKSEKLDEQEDTCTSESNQKGTEDSLDASLNSTSIKAEVKTEGISCNGEPEKNQNDANDTWRTKPENVVLNAKEDNSDMQNYTQAEESMEESLDELSVEQSLVIRNLK